MSNDGVGTAQSFESVLNEMQKRINEKGHKLHKLVRIEPKDEAERESESVFCFKNSCHE